MALLLKLLAEVFHLQPWSILPRSVASTSAAHMRHPSKLAVPMRRLMHIPQFHFITSHPSRHIHHNTSITSITSHPSRHTHHIASITSITSITTHHINHITSITSHPSHPSHPADKPSVKCTPCAGTRPQPASGAQHTDCAGNPFLDPQMAPLWGPPGGRQFGRQN